MPALIDTGLALLRYTTEQYIAADPTIISLKRIVTIQKPGGGHDKIASNLGDQIFRFINQTASTGIEFSASDGGESRKFAYILVGKYDADIAIGDFWEENNGNKYKVDALWPHNGYETRASVTVFAEVPVHG